jgi:hypothetical protein
LELPRDRQIQASWELHHGVSRPINTPVKRTSEQEWKTGTAVSRTSVANELKMLGIREEQASDANAR